MVYILMVIGQLVIEKKMHLTVMLYRDIVIFKNVRASKGFDLCVITQCC